MWFMGVVIQVGNVFQNVFWEVESETDTGKDMAGNNKLLE